MLDNRSLSRMWDYADPRVSESRLRAARDAAAAAEEPVERDELTTQVARALGLQGEYASAEAELAAISSDVPVVQVRVLLERGRIANSSSDRAGAVRRLHEAARLAREHSLTYLLVDALHMLAIADPAYSGLWTDQGIEVAQRADEQTQVWMIALSNNRGWDFFDAGDFAMARQYFEQAEQWADRMGTRRQQQLAREALAECDAAIRAAEPARDVRDY